ncbi:MAG: hypothetical protein JNL49_06345 [Bacteroidia bacterium]|nr:hypothetical protein [Bacteroidia bacterium]
MKNQKSRLKESSSYSFYKSAPAFKWVYAIYKTQLSTRTHNVLQTIEASYNGMKSTKDLEQFLIDVKEGKIDFLKLQNAGNKTVNELNLLYDNLLQTYNTCSDKKLSVINKLNAPYLEIVKFYPGFGEKEFNEIRLKNGKINLLLAMSMYLKGIKSNKRVFSNAIKEYYFSARLKNKTEIADKIHTTKERVRQIVVEAEDSLVKRGIDFLFSKYKDKLFYDHATTTANIAVVNLGEVYRTKVPGYEIMNSRFIKLISEHYFTNLGYISIDKIVSTDPYKYSFFDTSKHLVYFKVDKINAIQFSTWLEKLNTSLARHFNSETEFLVADVIREACQRRIALSVQQTNKFVDALGMNVKDLTDTAIKRRHEKFKLQRITIDLIRQYILDEGVGVTTEMIIVYLEQHGIIYTKNQLIHLFRLHPDKIAYTGLSGWVLKEQIKREFKSTSIKKFVENILINRNEPVHISELLSAVNKFKKISENSLRANMYNWRGTKFVHYNCSFWGIANTKYSSKWNRLPSVKGTKDILLLANKFSKSQLEKFAKKIERETGIPKVHIVYLYNKKHGIVDC